MKGDVKSKYESEKKEKPRKLIDRFFLKKVLMSRMN